MIVNPEWLKPKEKPYFHQISMDCLEKLVDCIGRFNKGEIDADTSFKMFAQILTDEIQDTEFTANGLRPDGLNHYCLPQRTEREKRVSKIKNLVSSIKYQRCDPSPLLQY